MASQEHSRPRTRVYGKRTGKLQTLTSQIFANENSSSPLQNPTQNTETENARQVGQEQALKEKSEEGVACSDTKSDLTTSLDLLDPIDALGSKFDTLELAENESNKELAHAATRTKPQKHQRGALRLRDVNIDSGPKCQPAATRGTTESRRTYGADQQHTVITKPRVLGADCDHVSPGAHNSSRIKTRQNSQTKSVDTAAADQNDCALNTPTRPRRTTRKPQAIQVADEILTYTRPLLSLCRDPAGQQAPSNFQEWANSIDEYFTVTKIAEASYGEVYRLSLKDRMAEFTAGDESVLKIIALKPPMEQICKARKTKESKKIAAMSAVNDVASEAQLLQRMSPVPGFTNFREVRVMQGRLPKQFVKAWKHFHQHVKESLFPDPGRKTSYDETQLWAVLEMQDAGQDLENIKCEDVWLAWDAFWGVALSLAKGEEWARFEHRDLHLGNICTKFLGNDQLAPVGGVNLSQKLHSPGRKVGFTGIETTLIDYTLSRADMSTSPLDESFDRDVNDTAYFDLAKDEAIFEGDGAEDYQYDIYRHMRAAITYGDPMAAVDGRREGSKKKGSKKATCKENSIEAAASWKSHHPMTNLVWLHFVLFKLLEGVTVWPSLSGNEEPEVARKIEEQLVTLKKVLALETMSLCGLRSAADLVNWAIGEGWLDEEDVVGRGSSNVPDEVVSPSQDRRVRRENARAR